MTKERKNNYIYEEKKIYIDILKIFACFMVIINHTNGCILENNNFLNSTFYCITFALCKTGVPIFLMITGALTLDKDYSFCKILNKIFKVAFPVMGLSFILYLKNIGVSNFQLFSFFKNILSEPYEIPYWYVYALIGAYLTIPFLQKMIKNFNHSDFFLFVVLFLLIPPLYYILQLYANLIINNNFIISFFPTTIAFIVCGNYLSKISINSKIFIISIFSFFISYTLMFLSLYLPYLNNSQISYLLDSWNTFPVVIMSISIFIIFRYLFENAKTTSRLEKVVGYVASTTFGIYLIHFLLNHKLYNLVIVKDLFSYSPILGVITLDILIFVVSMVIIGVLKKIPIIKYFL